MFYVYLLRSTKDGTLYIGYTKDLRQRLEQHRKGRAQTTKKHLPVELVYYEAYKSQKDAVSREQGLKHYGKALAQLKRRIRESLTTVAKVRG